MQLFFVRSQDCCAWSLTKFEDAGNNACKVMNCMILHSCSRLFRSQPASANVLLVDDGLVQSLAVVTGLLHIGTAGVCCPEVVPCLMSMQTSFKSLYSCKIRRPTSGLPHLRGWAAEEDKLAVMMANVVPLRSIPKGGPIHGGPAKQLSATHRLEC